MTGPLPPAVDADTLAALLGLTGNRVNALARDGVLPRDGRAFPLPAAVAAYCAWARENPAGRRTASPDLAAERTRLVSAQADRAEAQAAREAGELIPAADVRAAWMGFATDLRAALLALPERVATALGLDRAATAALDREMRAALEVIADAP